MAGRWLNLPLYIGGNGAVTRPCPPNIAVHQKSMAGFRPAPTHTMSQNLISQTMTNAQRDAMMADLDAFDAKWAPYKTTQTPEEIARLSKLSPGNIGLLEVAYNHAIQNPNSFPANTGVAELGLDIALGHQAIMVDQKTQQKANQTHNTVIVVMSDGWVTARKIYRIALAEGRTPENTAFLDAFGAHFEQEPPPAPPTP